MYVLCVCVLCVHGCVCAHVRVQTKNIGLQLAKTLSLVSSSTLPALPASCPVVLLTLTSASFHSHHESQLLCRATLQH